MSEIKVNIENNPAIEVQVTDVAPIDVSISNQPIQVEVSNLPGAPGEEGPEGPAGRSVVSVNTLSDVPTPDGTQRTITLQFNYSSGSPTTATFTVDNGVDGTNAKSVTEIRLDELGTQDEGINYEIEYKLTGDTAFRSGGSFLAPRGPKGDDGASISTIAHSDINQETIGGVDYTVTTEDVTDTDGGQTQFNVFAAKGDTGNTGRSAYEEYVAGGGTDNEATWLASLKGTPGTAATVDVNSTITGNPGTNAIVTNVGDSTNAELRFTIPQGAKGDTGNVGNTGPEGESAYQTWLGEGNTGDEETFLNSLKGTPGAAGADGRGIDEILATHEDTIEGGVRVGEDTTVEVRYTSGSPDSFTIHTLDGAKGEQGQQGMPGNVGATGASAYQTWVDEGNIGDEEAFLNSLKGATGDNGLSAYQEYVAGGGTLSEADWLISLEGEDGAKGDSAYQVYVAQATADGADILNRADWLLSLKGDTGLTGATGTTIDSIESDLTSVVTTDTTTTTPVTVTLDNQGTKSTQEFDIESARGLQGDAGLHGDDITDVQFADPQSLSNGDSQYTIRTTITNPNTAISQTIDSGDVIIPQGPKGDTGTGEQGLPGESAYQIWLDEGNVGDEEDFLRSLKGMDGTGTVVNANPGEASTNDELDSITIGGTNYNIGGGSNIAEFNSETTYGPGENFTYADKLYAVNSEARFLNVTDAIAGSTEILDGSGIHTTKLEGIVGDTTILPGAREDLDALLISKVDSDDDKSIVISGIGDTNELRVEAQPKQSTGVVVDDKTTFGGNTHDNNFATTGAIKGWATDEFVEDSQVLDTNDADTADAATDVVSAEWLKTKWAPTKTPASGTTPSSWDDVGSEIAELQFTEAYAEGDSFIFNGSIYRVTTAGTFTNFGQARDNSTILFAGKSLYADDRAWFLFINSEHAGALTGGVAHALNSANENLATWLLDGGSEATFIPVKIQYTPNGNSAIDLVFADFVSPDTPAKIAAVNDILRNAARYVIGNTFEIQSGDNDGVSHTIEEVGTGLQVTININNTSSITDLNGAQAILDAKQNNIANTSNTAGGMVFANVYDTTDPDNPVLNKKEVQLTLRDHNDNRIGVAGAIDLSNTDYLDFVESETNRMIIDDAGLETKFMEIESAIGTKHDNLQFDNTNSIKFTDTEVAGSANDLITARLELDQTTSGNIDLVINDNGLNANLPELTTIEGNQSRHDEEIDTIQAQLDSGATFSFVQDAGAAVQALRMVTSFTGQPITAEQITANAGGIGAEAPEFGHGFNENYDPDELIIYSGGASTDINALEHQLSPLQDSSLLALPGTIVGFSNIGIIPNNVFGDDVFRFEVESVNANHTSTGTRQVFLRLVEEQRTDAIREAFRTAFGFINLVAFGPGIFHAPTATSNANWLNTVIVNELPSTIATVPYVDTTVSDNLLQIDSTLPAHNNILLQDGLTGENITTTTTTDTGETAYPTTGLAFASEGYDSIFSPVGDSRLSPPGDLTLFQGTNPDTTALNFTVTGDGGSGGNEVGRVFVNNGPDITVGSGATVQLAVTYTTDVVTDTNIRIFHGFHQQTPDQFGTGNNSGNMQVGNGGYNILPANNGVEQIISLPLAEGTVIPTGNGIRFLINRGSSGSAQESFTMELRSIQMMLEDVDFSRQPVTVTTTTTQYELDVDTTHIATKASVDALDNADDGRVTLNEQAISDLETASQTATTGTALKIGGFLLDKGTYDETNEVQPFTGRLLPTETVDVTYYWDKPNKTWWAEATKITSIIKFNNN